MQMNRLAYAENEAFKHRHRVAIEKTLYVDRYLIENKAKSEQLSQHVHKLREQIRHLEASIKEYTSFGGSEYDIRKIFQLMNTFFTQQDMHKGAEDWSSQGGLCNHPLKDQIEPKDKGETQKAVGILNQYHAQLSGQADQMEKKVQELEASIKAAYGIPDMMKRPYHLHSICVHDGNAMSGHYYTFIYDRFNQKWRRYNDIRVTEVSEEDVLKEAEGGHSWQTAYWIVYVEDSIAKELNAHNLNSYRVPEDPFHLQSFDDHYYGASVPEEVNVIVEVENRKLATEIDDQKNQAIIKAVRDLYNKRWAEYKAELDNKDFKAPSAVLPCAHAFLYNKDKGKEVELLKKVLMAECFQEAQEKPFSTLDPESTLYKAM
jgi:ubiquitin carboxyl-terminal hydrolase 25/28